MKSSLRSIVSVATFFVALSPAASDTFFKDKQMQIIISTAAGTVFDSYARLLAQYMEKHLPGSPKIIALNMPGAGGIRAINHLAHNVPKDGSVIAMTNQGVPMYQALELGDALRVDVRDLNWIGNMSSSNQVFATWHTSPTKTLEDAKRRETVVGITGVGSINSQLPHFFNTMLGTKLRIVGGYKAGTDINLAMERGELEGRGSNTWASYEALNADWIKSNRIIPIIQVGVRKEPNLKTVPLLIDLANNEEERAIYALISQVAMISRPIVTTPSTPIKRVEALRNAFMAAMIDPGLLNDAAKQRMDLSVLSGIEIQNTVAEIVNAPKDIRAKAKVAMGL